MHRSSSVATLLLALGLATWVGSVRAETPISPRDATERCKNLLFGDPQDLRRVGSEGLAARVRFLDEEGVDRQVTLIQVHGDVPTIEVVSTVGGSVDAQLRSRVGEGGERSFEAACREIRVETALPEIDPDRLRDLVDDLQELSISPALEAPLVLDGTHYRLWVVAAPASFSYFDFFGAGADTAGDNPLQAWIDRLAGLAAVPPCPAGSPVLEPGG